MWALKTKPSSSSSATASNGVVLRRSAINNSLPDLSDATAEKMTRRGSVGSLDSGMSVSFQSTNTVVAGSFCIGNGSANGNAIMHHGHQQQQNHQHYPGSQQHGQLQGNQRRGGGGYSSQARRRNK